MVCLLQIGFYRFADQFNVYLFHGNLFGNGKGPTAAFSKRVMTASALWLGLAVSEPRQGLRKVFKPQMGALAENFRN